MLEAHKRTRREEAARLFNIAEGRRQKRKRQPPLRKMRIAASRRARIGGGDDSGDGGGDGNDDVGGGGGGNGGGVGGEGDGGAPKAELNSQLLQGAARSDVEQPTLHDSPPPSPPASSAAAAAAPAPVTAAGPRRVMTPNRLLRAAFEGGTAGRVDTRSRQQRRTAELSLELDAEQLAIDRADGVTV